VPAKQPTENELNAMNHQKLPLLILGLLTAAASPAAEWRNGAEDSTLSAAFSQAKRENKKTMIFFTGSDWCSWCMKLDNEVFSQREFDTYARSNLVLVKIDFPNRGTQSDAMKKANQTLKQKMGVTGFPTMHFFNSDGKQIGRAGYQPGGVAAFTRIVDQMGPKPGAGQQATHVTVPPELLPFGGAPTHPPIRYTNLVLKSISGTPSRRFALVNDQTFAAGDTLPVKLLDGKVNVRCMEVREQSVLVAVHGEDAPREIKLRP
jgi:thioredoxin-related protein